MNFAAMKGAIVRFGAKAGVKISEHAPEILVGGGTVLMVAGTVVACYKTPGVDDILEDHKARMAKIVEARQLAEQKKMIYTPETQRINTVQEFLTTGGKFAKLYSPAIILEALGIACILTGHHILKTRHLAMAAAYSGLQKSYSDYRERIVEEFGKDADFRAANGARKESFEGIVEEDGTVSNAGDYDNVIDPEHIDMYSVLFDDMYSGIWTPNAVTNMAQIKSVEEYWNGRFEQRGFVYYFEVLKDLAIWDRLPYDKQKQLIGKGWVWGCGDNRISLGIFDVNKPISDAKKEFIMGYEPSILIEPNIDGDVASLL